MLSQGRLLLLLALLSATPVWAQASRPAQPKGPWWDAADARTEANRVLKLIPKLIQSTERSDGSQALTHLRDANWIVRRLAAVRLEAMGMAGTSVAKLKQRGTPNHTPPPLTWKPYVAAKQFVAGLTVEPRPVALISLGEASRIVSGLVDVQLRSGLDTIPTKLRLVGGLLAFRACLRNPKDRAWLAGTILELTDEEQILSDLGLQKKTRKKAFEKGGRKVYRWFRDNVTYLYWHAHHGRFRLDREARSHKTASTKYRAKHPWKKGTGPYQRGPGTRQQ